MRRPPSNSRSGARPAWRRSAVVVEDEPLDLLDEVGGGVALRRSAVGQRRAAAAVAAAALGAGRVSPRSTHAVEHRVAAGAGPASGWRRGRAARGLDEAGEQGGLGEGQGSDAGLPKYSWAAAWTP